MDYTRAQMVRLHADRMERIHDALERAGHPGILPGGKNRLCTRALPTHDDSPLFYLHGEWVPLPRDEIEAWASVADEVIRARGIGEVPMNRPTGHAPKRWVYKLPTPLEELDG